MMAPDPLDNNRNWVRAAMGLKYLKEGLESFVENEIINLQTTFLQDIRSSHGLPPTSTCNQCTIKAVLSGKCPNKLCDKIAVKIVDQHRFTQRNPNGLVKNNNAPCWKNTDVAKWCSFPWEIAKCFMAKGYSGKMSAKETDCTGILSVLINCLCLQNNLTTRIIPPNDIISKMRETRNKIMHSSNLEVTDVELQQYIDDMIDILDDSKTIQANPDAVTARTKLNQIKNNTLVISSRDELKVRKEAVEAFEEKQKQLLDRCHKSQLDLQQKQKEILEQCQQQQTNIQQKHIEILDQFQKQQTDLQQKQTEFLDQCQKNRDNLILCADQARSSIAQIEKQCEQKQEEIKSSQSQLNSRVDSLQTQIKHVVEEEKQCRQKQDNLQFSQSQLYLTMDSLQSQMEQVVEAVRQCQLDINRVQSVHGLADTHREHVKKLELQLENRQLLQTRLREKYTYLSTIPLSPIMKNMKVDINKVYQKLVIRPDLIHDPNPEKKDLQDENIYSENPYLYLFVQNGTETTQIDYRKVFYKDSVPCKNIFVVGNGGVGKTTWCLKLLSYWLNCETNDEDKDNDFLPRFAYIFYVQLRHTKQASQINDMIKSFLFSDEHDLMNTVNDVLLNEPEQCLVLLDGLDEWKLPSEQRINDMGLPHDPMHSKFTTLITSRPWKLEILRLEPPAIDKAVEIKGLDEDGIRRLAGHIIDQLNCSRNSHDKKLKEFMDCIRNRKMPMIEVPLLLSIFVYLWYDNDFIGETFSGLYGKLTVNLFKTAEGDKKRIRQNLEVSKLENITDIIKKRNERTSEITMPIPDCLKDLSKSYIPLLYSLGKLAFYGLISKNIESFLVFNQESIEEYMSEEELEVALYIGILSQSQTNGDSTGVTFSISFMHKTIQEFLAAVYMVSATEHDETVNIKLKFTSYCKEIENVFEIENILIFICGMDPELAGELTRQISIMHTTKTIKRESFGISDDERLHESLLRCVEEEHLYSNKSNHVYIVNHFIKPDTGIRQNQNKINAETLGYITLNHKRVPMCLDIELWTTKDNNADEHYMNMGQSWMLRSYTRDPEKDKKDKYEYEDAICRCFMEVHSLETLRLYGGIVSLYNDKVCLRISECINRLECQTLELQNISGNLGHIDLSNNTELTVLSLKCIHVEELSLPQDGCIETIKLESIEHQQGDHGRLTLNMNNQTYLTHLTIEAITGNIGHIDLSNNTKLTHLIMTSLQLEEFSLPQNGCLENFWLQSIKHPQGDQGNFTLNINNQPYLILLTLEDISGNIGHINMSNNSKLTYLFMTSLQIEELSLPKDGCLKRVRLLSIKHSQGDQGNLTLNMNNQLYLKSFTLVNISCNIGHIDLSKSKKLTDVSVISEALVSITVPQGVEINTERDLERIYYCIVLNICNQRTMQEKLFK